MRDIQDRAFLSIQVFCVKSLEVSFFMRIFPKRHTRPRVFINPGLLCQVSSTKLFHENFLKMNMRPIPTVLFTSVQD